MLIARALTLLLPTAALLVVGTGVAKANGGGGATVTCAGNGPAPTCSVTADTPGRPGVPAPAPPAPPTTGVTSCAVDGRPAPCSLPGYGWLGANGCYYRPDPTYQPPAGDTADLPPGGAAGGYYDVSCLGTAGTGEAVTWLAAGTAPGPPPTAAILAQQATRQLNPTVGAIASSPPVGSEQLVDLPTWVWLSSWTPATATAAVPGLSVTATATPVSAAWTFGDGSRVVCAGPGTLYTPADSPSGPSPTCGHTYNRPSTDEPGGGFPVAVTVTWSIAWAGGGQSGTEPPLHTTRVTAFRVAESQAVNTAPTGGS